MSKHSESTQKNLAEDGASVAANAAPLDAPIGMKEPKKQLSQKTNDYIKKNQSYTLRRLKDGVND